MRCLLCIHISFDMSIIGWVPHKPYLFKPFSFFVYDFQAYISEKDNYLVNKLFLACTVSLLGKGLPPLFLLLSVQGIIWPVS